MPTDNTTTIMKKTILFLYFLSLSALIQAQQSPNTRIASTKSNVQFEIQQKEELLQASTRAEADLRTLFQSQRGDEEILKALDIKDILTNISDKLAAANERQAIFAETLTAQLKGEISAQEQIEYRKYLMIMGEIARAQSTVSGKTKQLQQALNTYFRTLPPPPVATLPSGLTLTLIPATEDCPAFYVSAPLQFMAVRELPLPTNDVNILSKAPNLTDSAVLNHFQAMAAARIFSARERVNLQLPSQAQFKAMAQADHIPEIAVWSRDEFTSKNSLSRIKTHQSKLQSTLEQQILTPSQRAAASRFRCTFYLIWDPRNHLGGPAFSRELPHSSYPKLGVILTAPAQYGYQQHLDALIAKRQNAPIN